MKLGRFIFILSAALSCNTMVECRSTENKVDVVQRTVGNGIEGKPVIDNYGSRVVAGDNKKTASDEMKILSSGSSGQEEEKREVSGYESFVLSASMIVVSEIGDKTFLIAALMAMKNSRVVVFSAAFSSLVLMTVLSGIVGHALPSLISQRLTQFLASVLFLIFGVKLLREGLSMSKDVGVEEELAEVEEEIASSDINHKLEDIEGGGQQKQEEQKLLSWAVDCCAQIKDLASFILSPIWIQVFIMTFLGEWGDRSQIATIAMAAGSDYWFVILGAIVGHGICTAAACIGGKLLASRISMRNVTLGGAIAFFVFSVLYFYDSFFHGDEQISE
ncbi:Piso0_003997 [Millerozyma farinosa CBS 7064]|uniref:GDT1 family protein n=1 Tax=Pichia sorbitophila (strain ATCC MYA-4447 / BCRC 22081 / CBS 7064 / NBRC 10061 / NRRL Y-12695) TaxID=559304 RepID=G8YA39_PICSO|nr:Piso0_003997 [Millerozyma farinosa CBS 7064]CCE84453.1 Piso0_003997 [Millerozyma farinosa CBS 7064]